MSEYGVGVDAYKSGWVAVALNTDGFERAVAARHLRDIVAEFADAAAIAVDIPIGLPARGQRRCDRAAAKMVGPRRSSVFVTPPRAALVALTHSAGSAICIELTGQGMTQQAFGLRTKILETESVARDDLRIFEVHPEVSFRAMAGANLASAKGTWAGMWDRIELLRDQNIEVPRNLGPAEHVPPTDVIDAAAAAWTALRRVRRADASVSEPEVDVNGRLVSIWY